MTSQQSFQKIFKEDKLSHSYIFFGSPDLEFIKQLADVANYPADYLQINPDISATGRESVGIDKIRSIQNFLWRTPSRAQRKLAVVNRADKLTGEAQNAVLKIAEEPPSRSLLIMLIKDPELLLPALASRFQKIYFPPKQPTAPTEAVEKFLSVGQRERSGIIRELATDGQQLEELIGGVMAELAKNSVKNFKPLKELCYRWSLISRYNTNKRLQLEAWLESFT